MCKYARIDHLLLLLLAGLFPLLGYTQAAVPELKRVADRYRSLAGFSMKVSADFYVEESGSKPAKTLSGGMEIQGSLSHSVFDRRETVLGQDFVLMADHVNRAIYYSPREKSSKNNVSTGTEVLDSVFLSNYKITEKTGENNTLEYQLRPKKTGGEFSSILIRIDRQNHILKEIVYLYSGVVKYPKVVIRYSAFNASWKGDKTFFSESRFITGHQKNARLLPAYSSYRLINSFNYDPKKNLIDP